MGPTDPLNVPFPDLFDFPIILHHSLSGIPISLSTNMSYVIIIRSIRLILAKKSLWYSDILIGIKYA